MQNYSVRYVHKISPKDTDTGPDIRLEASALIDRKALGAAMRNGKLLMSGEAIRHFRVEHDGKVVVFPPSGSIWWSIILTPNPLPSYDDKLCHWIGGDSYTLYTFTDKRTGSITVAPGSVGNLHIVGIGPECTVRLATHAEAEEHWQKPLHSGWKVAP